MGTAGMNALALARFGGFHVMHGRGDAGGLLLMGLVAVGVVVWALSRSGRSQSARN
jgi:cbb3-type cytochrome oxidase subunit 3